jgi:PRC-barrel domain
MGTEVFGPDGEKVGVVEDLILDEQQKITGVVVGVGGFLGIGEKEVGLNWEQAKLVESADTGARSIMIGMTKAELEAAPDFVTKAEREAEAQAAAQQQQMMQQQQQQAVPPTTTPTQ